jgi:hypothetical protein
MTHLEYQQQLEEAIKQDDLATFQRYEARPDAPKLTAYRLHQDSFFELAVRLNRLEIAEWLKTKSQSRRLFQTQRASALSISIRNGQLHELQAVNCRLYHPRSITFAHLQLGLQTGKTEIFNYLYTQYLKSSNDKLTWLQTCTLINEAIHVNNTEILRTGVSLLPQFLHNSSRQQIPTSGEITSRLHNWLQAMINCGSAEMLKLLSPYIVTSKHRQLVTRLYANMKITDDQVSFYKELLETVFPAQQIFRNTQTDTNGITRYRSLATQWTCHALSAGQLDAVKLFAAHFTSFEDTPFRYRLTLQRLLQSDNLACAKYAIENLQWDFNMIFVTDDFISVSPRHVNNATATYLTEAIAQIQLLGIETYREFLQCEHTKLTVTHRQSTSQRI